MGGAAAQVAAALAAAEAAEAQESAAATAGADGQQWTEYFDDGAGLPYWYCTQSGESTWERPRGL